jgi:transposase InsO family protein
VLLNIQIGKKWTQHTCIVAEIANDGILGTDYLKSHGLVIDFSTNRVTCDGEILVSRCREGTNRVCRVMVAESVILPPGTRTIIKGLAKKPLSHGNWLVEPLSHTPGNKPVLTAKTLTRTVGTRLPVEILNPTDEEVTLYKYTNLGLLHKISDEKDIIEMPSDEDQVAKVHLEPSPNIRPEDTTPLPDEIEKLVNDIEVPLTPNQQTKVRQMLHRNLRIFSTSDEPYGRTDLVQHEIETDSQTPIKQAVRRVPIHLRDESRQEVSKMLKAGIVQPSNSPWASPVVLVRKKDGTIRFCIDYRKLNDVTKKDSYPLPRIDESLDSLGKARYFTTLDLASGYWQIGLTDEAKEKSAFCTPQGLFEFIVMPFGLTNAPATFQRLMERVLTGLQWQTCLVYIDDIIIFSNSVEHHITQLQRVFDRLKDAGLKLKPKKCCLFRKKVKYLGHLVSGQGIETDPDKVSAVKNWPRPQNLKDVRSFVGFCSYYRRFLPNFASEAKPLITLTEKNVTFHWGDEQEAAWTKMKTLLIEAPVLAYPQPEITFILDTDASDLGIGAVLSQEVDGEEKVICYGSRVLTKQEKRYCVTRRELLAVVHFVKMYRHYLIGQHFIIRSDHAALRWLKSFKEPEGQVARWLEVLDTYNYTLIHRPGIKHGNADALSRGACPQCHGDHQGEVIRKGRHKTVQHIEVKQQKLATVSPDDTVIPQSPLVNPIQLESGSGLTSNEGLVKRASPLRGRGDRDSSREPLDEGQEMTNLHVCPVMTRAKQGLTSADGQVSNWLASAIFNPETIKQQQRADPVLSEIFGWVKTSVKPSYGDISAHGTELKFYWGQLDSIKIVDGILTRELELVNRPTRRQILAPPPMRQDIMTECHNVRTAGHLGRNKTMASVKRRFLWPGMHRDVELYVKQCDVCAQYKTVGRGRRAELKDHRVGYPLERVCIDIVGPFPQSTQGNKYALVVTDYFTKYVEIYPMPNQEAATVAKSLVCDFFSRFGVPDFLHSDQGTQFESALFAEICTLLGITKTRTTPFRPQSDGQSERNIKTLTKMIAMATQDQAEWDEHLPFISMAYRSTPHETLGLTPNYLMFGREISMPIDVMVPLKGDEQLSAIEYVNKLRSKLIYAYELARNKLKASAERQKRLYNRHKHGDELQLGQVVWYINKLRKKGVSPKLQPKWRGPFLIVRKHNDILVEIQMTARKFVTVHTDLLKPCFASKLPGWLRRVRKNLV